MRATGIVLAASYTVEAGPWTGPVVTQLPVGDPQLAAFGPATGHVVDRRSRTSNPLSTRMRFAYPTRGEGQVMAPAQKTLGLKIGKKLNLTRTQQRRARGEHLQSAQRRRLHAVQLQWRQRAVQHANYLQMRNQQPARALQVTVVYRF